MQKEIEVKIKIQDSRAAEEKLSRYGCVLSSPVMQEDVIFADPAVPFAEFKSNINILRIRNEGGRSIFTLKRPQANEFDAIERELEISDSEQMRDILEYLGYKEMVQVRKLRKKGTAGGYQVCLDDVEGLGIFLELEKIADENAEKVQNDMMEFLASLGLAGERITKGYDTMMYLKKYHEN